MLRHLWLCLALLALMWSGAARAQEETAQEAAVEEAAPEETPLLTAEELEALVAPIAFYPDEVLAVTLPAATYPLDVVQAARFLEQQKSNPDAAPSEDWDPSILSLLNYPVVLNMMNEDLDWTTQLGEAVLNQQADVIDAIQQVRRTAYTGGQLQTNDQFIVTYENDTIEIECSDPDKVYIPIYEPAPAPPVAEQLPADTVQQLPADGSTATAEQLPADGSTTTVEQLPADGSTTVENTTVNNYYPSSGMTYSEPYTPYYDETAAFWTGALVGGVTMGFLMDWDDDDIDIDFDDGDFDDWEPGRGDINVDGDVNIGNDVNIGKGDSWRDMRAQRGERANQLPSTTSAKARKSGAQPVASQQARKTKATQKPAQKAGAGQKKKPAQNKAATQKPRKATTKQQPAQKSGALGNVERGQNTKKATQRGSGSQQKQLQQTQKRQQASPTNKQRQNVQQPKQRQQVQQPKKRQSSGAFGPSGNSKQMKRSSSRGGGSQIKRSRR